MKRAILLIGFITLIPLQLHPMEPLEPKIQEKKILIPTLQDLSSKTWMQKKLIPLLRENIGNFTKTYNEIQALTQNASHGVLRLLGSQFYDMRKPALTNLLLQKPIVSFEVPQDSDYFVNLIAFDPLGRYCLAMKIHIDYEGKKKQIDLYTLPRFTLARTFKITCDQTQFSPQGKFLATYHKKSGLITLLDTHNDFAPCTFKVPKSVYAFNGPETILFSTNEYGACQMWDINTQQKIETNLTIPGALFSVQQLGNYILYCTVSTIGQRPIDTITLITENNQQLSTITIDASQYGITSGYCQFALHPENRLLAMSSYGNNFIWNFEKNALIRRFEHQDNINSLTFDKSGKFLASASDDLTASLWNIETGEGAELYADSRHIVENVTFSPHNNILFSSDECIRLWDLSKPQPPLLSSTAEHTEDSEITVCPITTQGLLFAGAHSEGIWCAPTPHLFTFEQLIWIYAASWAKKNLEGEKLKIYITDLNNRIDVLFAEHTELIRNHLHNILK